MFGTIYQTVVIVGRFQTLCTVTK